MESRPNEREPRPRGDAETIRAETPGGAPPARASTRGAPRAEIPPEAREAPRPRSLNARVDRDLKTIVMTCMEKDRGRGYATAREADSIALIGEAESLLAVGSTDPALERLTRAPREYEPLAAAGENRRVARAHLLSGRAFRVRGDAARARTEFARAWQQGADRTREREAAAERLLEIATGYAASGQHDRAAAACERILVRFPGASIVPRALLARRTAVSDSDPAARAARDEALKLNAGGADVLVQVSAPGLTPEERERFLR